MHYRFDDVMGFVHSHRRQGTRVRTPADWSAGREATGWTTRYNFVFTDRENRTKEDWPYAYTDHFLWGSHASIKGAEAVYSDRLYQWNRERAMLALSAIKGENSRYGYWSAEAASKYLSVFFDRQVTVVAVSEGCNISNGYPYHVFYYKEGKA